MIARDAAKPPSGADKGSVLLFGWPSSTAAWLNFRVIVNVGILYATAERRGVAAHARTTAADSSSHESQRRNSKPGRKRVLDDPKRVFSGRHPGDGRGEENVPVPLSADGSRKGS